MRKADIKQCVNNLGAQLAGLESAAGLEDVKDCIESLQQAMKNFHQEAKSTATDADLASVVELIRGLDVAKGMLQKSDGYTASLRFWLSRWYLSFSDEYSTCTPLQMREEVSQPSWRDELARLQHNFNSLSYLMKAIPLEDLDLIQQTDALRHY